ncbi:DUF642 domain-containing protein [Colwellia sp. 1_MG-2023]|uniref:DUF642 domain-containing protein n=1 Tax=unclassified Colwellia TaxID=196834 RepID=UPI001C09E52D|nr:MULTISPECIES: DUF642 domain-containing protein [unclassified Colwellia]MBU2924419.1 DUF642 domain-containing protein [Colwellia sp. C2M11]MDO6653079.1 DUF642 domain-containing protein [Colwellia sp. 3_MG-2023]MDO6665934.1 DUF642 domain-containing protein [Colwellia sp. 2_MG-2023]MDO6690307.1 DUF642 domain-containing protein [Colwellia sp. 1_MG-2023]
MSKFINKIVLTLSFTCLTSLANASLITNGSFEQTTYDDNSVVSGTIFNTDLQTYDSANGIWDVFSSLPGWTTSGGSGIELQKGIISQSQDGSNHVELDSHAGTSNSVMTQTINALTVGQNYLLEFYYKPRTNILNDNGINVFWYDAAKDFSIDIDAVLVADSTVSLTPDWALQSILFTAEAESMNLSFGSSGIQNTLGGLIDNVSLKQSTAVPEPSMIALFLTALAFLVVRKQKAS